MKITDTGTFKGDTYFFEVDSEEKYFVHQTIFIQFGICKDMEISEEKLNEIVDENTYRRAKERALYLIDRREYGFKELYKKLLPNYDEKICLRVCKKLAELGIINDRRYAARLAEYYTQTKKFGKYRAKQEIILRGISPEAAEEELEKFSDGETDIIKDIISHKYEEKLADPAGVKKVIAALMRRGFSYSEIKKALEEYDFE